MNSLRLHFPWVQQIATHLGSSCLCPNRISLLFYLIRFRGPTRDGPLGLCEEVIFLISQASEELKITELKSERQSCFSCQYHQETELSWTNREGLSLLWANCSSRQPAWLGPQCLMIICNPFSLLSSIKIIHISSWGEGSTVKSASCFFQQPEFSSYHQCPCPTTTCNSNSRNSDILIWLSWVPAPMVVHLCTNIYMCT